MKNIHVLPTDKPSILIKDIWKNTFSLVENFNTNHTDFKAQHIIIISDEEIKVGDWFLSLISEKPQIEKEDASFLDKDLYKKIILTTDQDLIKNGIQAIDDEFLEWFVKNPSCEEVEVVFNNRGITGVEKILKTFGEYEIVIPKKRAIEELADNFLLHVNKIKPKNLEIDSYIKLGFINGAEQQSKIILSEIIQDLEKTNMFCSEFELLKNKWLKQFKI